MSNTMQRTLMGLTALLVTLAWLNFVVLVNIKLNGYPPIGYDNCAYEEQAWVCYPKE